MCVPLWVVVTVLWAIYTGLKLIDWWDCRMSTGWASYYAHDCIVKSVVATIFLCLFWIARYFLLR